MNCKKIQPAGFLLLAALWLLLTGAAWFGPRTEISEAERRKLEQFPILSSQTLLKGEFMTKFESFTQDQFPLRDSFRRMKALFSYRVLQKGDNNGIYLASGSAAKLEYPLNEAALENAHEKFQQVYELYLKDRAENIVFSVVPDKGYYLAEANGYPAMDYDRLFSAMEALPWAKYADLTGCLTAADYYRTDTHWRQENLLPTANVLCEALGVPAPREEDFRVTALDRPFYGVYYGQAALPMEPDTIRLLESDLLSGCVVTNYETGKTTAVYDRKKLESRDLYDVFLSGAVSVMTVENSTARTDRELIVFRDSFGSSLVPLLMQGYAKVTLLDLRYVPTAYLDRFVDFGNQDVLFLYSTIVLNNSMILK